VGSLLLLGAVSVVAKRGNGTLQAPSRLNPSVASQEGFWLPWIEELRTNPAIRDNRRDIVTFLQRFLSESYAQLDNEGYAGVVRRLREVWLEHDGELEKRHGSLDMWLALAWYSSNAETLWRNAQRLRATPDPAPILRYHVFSLVTHLRPNLYFHTLERVEDQEGVLDAAILVEQLASLITHVLLDDGEGKLLSSEFPLTERILSLWVIAAALDPTLYPEGDPKRSKGRWGKTIFYRLQLIQRLKSLDDHGISINAVESLFNEIRKINWEQYGLEHPWLVQKDIGSLYHGWPKRVLDSPLPLEKVADDLNEASAETKRMPVYNLALGSEQYYQSHIQDPYFWPAGLIVRRLFAGPGFRSEVMNPVDRTLFESHFSERYHAKVQRHFREVLSKDLERLKNSARFKQDGIGAGMSL